MAFITPMSSKMPRVRYLAKPRRWARRQCWRDVKVDHFEAITDYALVALSLPPFVAKTHVRFRGIFYGKDTGEIELGGSLHRFSQVKCYEDRFEPDRNTPELHRISIPGRD